MSFGVGVGDIIKIAELITHFRRRVIDAPSQYHDVLNDLKRFSGIIQDIDIILSEYEPNSEQRETLQGFKDDSTSLICDFKNKIDKHREIGSCSTHTTHRIKRAWKRLKWDPEDAQHFRTRILLILENVHGIERQLSSQRLGRIQQTIELLAKQAEEQKRNRILDWIRTIDYGSHQSDALEEHQEGTGDWLIRSEMFQKWIETKGQVLFCPGLPGAGKTILVAVAICHLLDRYENNNDVGIGYHYFDYKRQGVEDTRMILSSILNQLAQNVKVLCQKSIPKTANDKILEGCNVLEIRASDTDVRKYLECNMSKLHGLAAHDRQLQEVVCKAILGSMDGMFLLARLHLKLLSNKSSLRDVREALKALPTGTSAYDKAYQTMIERIERQDPDPKAIAKSVLTWLTFSKRRLKVAELRAAVSIRETDSDLDEACLYGIEDLAYFCTGLVRVDKPSQTVSLIHYTVQEYLERTRASWSPEADAMIATTCLTYLLFPAFDVDFFDFDKYSQNGRSDEQSYPLLYYCKEYAAYHTCLASPELPSIARFFSSNSRIVKNWLLSATKHGSPQAEDTAEWLIERGASIDVRDVEWKTPLHHAVLNGWKRCVQLLLQRGASLDPDSANMTPLHYTVKNSAKEIAQMFINAGIPIDLPVKREIYTPVFKEGRVIYINRDGAQNLIQNGLAGNGLTCLHLATLTGCRKMTEFLLNQGADPNFPSDHGETPLHLALRRDLYKSRSSANQDFWTDPDNRIESILDYVDEEDEYCSTRDWVDEARVAVVNLLLEHPEVDMNAKDVLGVSPLHVTARDRRDSGSMVQKLLEKGAKISTRTKKG
ncbi:hypothetical protein BFJ67_g17603 [Fusarium oxysporum f. sp. cepae]|nr:hypothetical protein BFJ67_g17603 [Fusarium oxysporum f. sp. cepae]